MKQQKILGNLATTLSVVAITGLGIAGCVTSPPQATFEQTLPRQHLVDSNDNVTIRVDARSGVLVTDYDKQRLSQLIKQKIDMQKASSTVSGAERDYELDVVLARYEKGNAFARAMLAGLGQIHIDAHVVMLVMPKREKLSEFDVKKTFAWGGVYGGITSIEDVEPAFAEGVANAVTQVKDPQGASGG